MESTWYLTMMRTKEQAFVPCVSTSGHEHIWTIRSSTTLKSTGLTNVPTSVPLGDNNPICLTFEFADNAFGYRDFHNDEQGLRHRHYPSHTNGRLVLAQAHPDIVADTLWRYMFMVDEKNDTALKLGTSRPYRANIAEFYLDVLGKFKNPLSP